MNDPFVSCPYDRAHRVPRSRIQAHLVRCEQRYPPLSICPYNATHRMPKELMPAHVEDCESRMAIFPEQRPLRVTAALTTPKPTLQKDYVNANDPDDEVWDN